ncbi:MAG: trehalose-phosphatase, partial [Solirubrobacterales bacterium]
LVGLEELTYIGNHGLERLDPGAAAPSPLLQAGAGDLPPASPFALDRRELAARGLRLEDKGPIQALHWRGASDEARAEAAAEERAAAAERAGLRVHRGRKVLEIRPDIDFDKGAAIARLLEGHRLATALYAGDDRTDVDAFDALAALRDDGRLTAAVNVGIVTPESPAEVAEAADIVVSEPREFWAILDMLAG